MGRIFRAPVSTGTEIAGECSHDSGFPPEFVIFCNFAITFTREVK
jgi:hypothetical protein